ncbi:MAG: hypothetical protein ACRCS8_00220 [Brevinema sp.]
MLRLLLMLLTIPMFSFGANVKQELFTPKYIVFYKVLHEMKGVSPSEFENVNIIKDTNTELVFEYGGITYEAKIMDTASETVYVTMPESDSKNSYLRVKGMYIKIKGDTYIKGLKK